VNALGIDDRRVRIRITEALRGAFALLRRLDRTLLLGFAAAALATVAFAQLLDEVHDNESLVHWDESASEWIADWRGRGLTGVMRVATHLADPVVVTALVLVASAVLLARRHRGAALFLVASTAGTGLLVLVAKLAIARPRPGVPVRLIDASGYAFPSGHAAQSLACYGALAIIAAVLIDDRRARVLVCTVAALTAFVVGLSRVVLGAHWFSDVVAGWVLAGGWLAVLLTGRRALLLRTER
jgi:undecaprenyl-diphosphatase